MLLPSLFMGFMVWALEVMHIFWTYYIVKGILQNSRNEKKINPNFI